MDDFKRWEKMLNSTGTCPKVWKVYEEMKQAIEERNQEIIVLKEDRGMLEREVIETIVENVLEKVQK